MTGNDIDVDYDAFSASTLLLLQAPLDRFQPQTLQSKVVARLQQLEREVLALRRRQNDTTFPCLLPAEILSQIFLALRSHWHFRSTLDGNGATKENILWIAVTHVCRHWRAVALDCGELWSDLPLTPPDALEAFLTRSKGSLISVKYHGQSPESMSALRGILQSDIHRLRSLILKPHDEDWLRILLFNNWGTASCLETLVVRCVTAHIGGPPKSFLRGGAPVITRLDLTNFAFDWEGLPLTATLLDLRLEAPRRKFAYERPSFPIFFHPLPQLTSLRVLELRRVLPCLDRTSSTTTESVSCVVLPSLVTLCLQDTSQHIHRFLELIRTPKTLSITLTFTEDVDDKIPGILKCIQASCADPSCNRFLTGRVKACCTGPDLMVTTMTDLELETNDPESVLKLALEFDTGGMEFDEFLDQLLQSLDFGSLLHLHIKPLRYLDGVEWRILGGLPCVSVLHIAYGEPHLFSLLEVLNEERDEGVDGIPRTPWFPALTTIKCDHLRFEHSGTAQKQFIDQLAGAVAARPEDKPPLELHIEAATNFDETYKYKIEQAVPRLKLVWDGIKLVN